MEARTGRGKERSGKREAGGWRWNKQQAGSCTKGEEKFEEKYIFNMNDDGCVDEDPIEMLECETVVEGKPVVLADSGSPYTMLDDKN
ncbi:hypothetical protein NDU88_009216 [Pleurodeles waltl]|uniref:Uncharacterized protein n=1 Tax=Pleurodeles waltl TaxID=8319 RepID=A0AAV7RXW2_PLEWA|nr:hypothetical protein NDU88_009216 [Pleurodeles waltl]